MKTSSVLASLVFCFALLMLTYGVLRWMNVPVGEFRDWLVGVLSFFWLMVVVTIPWNIHFQAKGVLADAASSKDRGLKVEETQVAYVQKLAKWSLVVAIALHVVSAGVLAIVGATVSQIGYVAAVLALLLTGLRPAASAYDYLAARLRNIGEDWKYPREDVVELKERVAQLEVASDEFKRNLDPNRADSIVWKHEHHVEETRRELAKVAAEVESLRATNENEHERLSAETRSAISQLSTDGQFLEHVREIIRFFKSA